MVDSRQAPGQVIRLLICRRNGDAKAQVLGRSSHGRHDSQRLIDRPLSSRDDGRVKVARALVDVVSAEHVCNEDAMKFGGFEQLGQLDPVVHVVEAPGLVVGVAPEARRLVAAAFFSINERLLEYGVQLTHFDKGVEDEALAGGHFDCQLSDQL